MPATMKLFSFGLALVLLIPVARAEEDPAAKVHRLVRQLDAPHLAERQAAEAELLRLGPTILDLLPAPEERLSAEAQQRLARVRQQLQQQAAEAIVQPSLITLPAASMPLSKILTLMEEQSGNRIIDYRRRFSQPLSDPAISVAFQKTPFWAALDQVLSAAKLRRYPFAEEPAVCLVAETEEPAPLAGRVCYSGPLRIEATDVLLRRDLRKADGRALVLRLEVSWEPRVQVISLAHPLADLQAEDEAGRKLNEAEAAGRLEVAVAAGGAPAVSLELPLRAPPVESRRLNLLAGKLSTILGGKKETFRFRNLTAINNARQRVANVTVTLQQVRKSEKSWEILLHVRFEDPGDALASHRSWVFGNEAYLESPAGKRIDFRSFETTAHGRNEVGLAYLFDVAQPLDGFSFVYKTPVSIMTRNFDYKLKDIPLP